MSLLLKWAKVTEQQLPNDIVPIFGYLPEFMLENIAEFYIFLCEFCPEQVTSIVSNQASIFVNFVTFVINCTEIISNPYIRAKLV